MTYYCRKCGKQVESKWDLYRTYDCHGIPYRLVCEDCYAEYEEQGYDGAYYDETDECIESDY